MPIDFIAISNEGEEAHFDWNVLETIMRIEFYGHLQVVQSSLFTASKANNFDFFNYE